MSIRISLFPVCVLWLSLADARADSRYAEVQVDPPILRLSGPNAGFTLLVQGKTTAGQIVDLTHSVHYRAQDPSLATVSELGFVRGLVDGTTTILVEAGGQTRRVAVTVTGAAAPRRFNFENDIIPILSRFGCNASGCHGKAEGQNGFKLSVFGFDPAADYSALTKEGRGRRIFPGAPEHSLLLAKVSGGTAHGGGLRIPRSSTEYETLRAWIAAGCPFGLATDPKVVRLRVEPSERVLAMGGRQQLRAIATYSDGREADVTPHAKFQSNNDALATVSGSGLVTVADVPGDVAIMAGFMNTVAVFRALVPRAESINPYPLLAENNAIDRLVFAKLRNLNLLPSEPAGDPEYLRRVYLDVIGTLPTPAEARRFLADKRLDRRARLVDELLERPEFADYWALKWADLLRVERQVLGHKLAYRYYQWIRDSLATNKPLDQFARELATADGLLKQVGPAAFYRVVADPGETASTVSQVFLGVRIGCAKCHHHPFDRWSQADYYGMQAFFAPVQVRGPAGEETVQLTGNPETRIPRTGELIAAHALDMPSSKEAKGDRRPALAAWLTAPANPYFARNLANRTWAHFLGRGLVEPVDDVRATNPPSNPELLDALATYFTENHYDFRQLIRFITASRVYQLSSHPNATNERDEQNYSRAVLKRVEAEVLLDMVCQTTGIGEKFPGTPEGCRAIQLWDSQVPHYFLKLFGRPVRVSACECERNHEPSVSQVLHFLNGPEVHAKISHEAGTVARLLRRTPDDSEVVENLYLTFYSRQPTDHERAVALAYLRKEPAGRRQAAEDLAWSMLNSLEFLFNH
jgi:hypothetical protein